MKTLIIGCGGVGSWVIGEIYSLAKNDQISPDVDMTIADDDIVEAKQITYQNFQVKEVGRYKIDALYSRYCPVFSMTERITKDVHLRKYDFIILCVDNEKTRKLVIDHCYKNNKDFIDIRAEGRRVFCMPRTIKEENLKFVDSNDNNSYSCQDKARKEKGEYDLANKAAAMIGAQMILNKLRGISNKIINITI